MSTLSKEKISHNSYPQGEHAPSSRVQYPLPYIIQLAEGTKELGSELRRVNREHLEAKICE